MAIVPIYAIRINEVSPRSPEFIEIYNENNNIINLSEWQIKDSSTNNPDDITCYNIANCSLITNSSYFLILGRNTNITEITSQNIEYYYIDDSEIGNGLNDDNGENITFFNLTFASSFYYNSSKQNKSWQDCSGGWKTNDFTPGRESNCTLDNTGNTPPTENNTTQQKITIEVDFPRRIYFGEEFEVDLYTTGLKNQSYDVKIEFKTNQTVSKTYNEELEKWITGDEYIKVDLGNYTPTIKLNITKECEEADVFIKIRTLSSDTIIANMTYSVSVDKRVINNSNNLNIDTIELKNESKKINQENLSFEIVNLGNRNVKSEFISREEMIKEYSLYGFLIFCTAILVFILIKLLR